MKAEMKAIRAIHKQLNRRTYRNKDGFSLVELLLVVLLIFTIVALVSVVLFGSENTSRDVISIVRSEIDARVAMYRISKDIRETISITYISDSMIEFESNIDSDEYYETVQYYTVQEDSHYNLYRKIDEETGSLYIKNIVDNVIFIYFDGLGTPAGGMDASIPITDADTLDTIKYVEINLNIDQSGYPSLRTMNLNTMITLRNRIY
jgi:competence protein ComGC